MAAKPEARTGRVLEKVDRRAYLDDTTPLTATILTYRILQSHVEYNIRVQRGTNPEDSWDVIHRYNEFAALQQSLQASSIQLNLPPKRVFGNTERQFLNERQQGLQEYLNIILGDPLLSNTLAIKRFLDPKSYTVNYYENAYRNVSMFFRSNPEWKIVEPLQEIGWRFRKNYFLIASKVDPKAPHKLLSWSEPGPDFVLGERDLDLLLKLLVEMKHPNILSPISATYNGTGLMVVRDYCPNGSLRDKIYQQHSPKHHYLSKYGVPAGRVVLSIDEVQRIGRQVLDALSFLKEKGYVLGHIHAGNVIMVDGVCKLVDLENSLLGLPVIYRSFLLELRKAQGAEAEAIYGFGHLLYEMISGKPLKTATMESVPPYTSPSAAEVLEALLSPAGVKALPSIADVLAKPMFSEVSGVLGMEKPVLKVHSKLKEAIRVAKERSDARLNEQQRRVSQARRVSKAHESMMSDEEKKKRRKKIRKQLTQQEKEGEASYPTSKLTRQASTPSASFVTSKNSQHQSSAKANPSLSAKASSSAPPPPKATPPDPRPQPPPDRSAKRGALLGSIEGFSKRKLKKTVTNDRSAPLFTR